MKTINKTINIDGKYMTVNELSKLLRITNASIINSINRGELPAIRIGSSYRIDVSQPLTEIYSDEHKENVSSERVQA